MTTACIYAALFGVGWLLMGQYIPGIISMAVFIVTLSIILKEIDKMDWEGIIQ